MPQFTYQARDSAGRLIAGELEAPDPRGVAVSLGRLGYRPIQIRSRSGLWDQVKAAPWKQGRVDRQEVLVLLRELSALLKAGIPLVSGLEGVMQQTQSTALRPILADVTRRVQGGASFSDALAGYPRVFPELFVSMIRVGEAAGILDQVCAQLAQLGAQEMENRSKIESAVIYPVVLIFFALMVVSGLLVGVLPKFVSVFRTSQVALPWPTRFLLGASWTVRELWWLLAAGLGVLAWWGRRYYASPAGRWRVDHRLLSLPLVGILYRKILISRITRILGAMLKTGVPLLEALSVAEKTISNRVFRHTIQQTRLAVVEGRSLSEIWRSSGRFPPLVLQLVNVGERSGRLDEMFTEIASFYEPEVDLTIRKLTTLLEPVLLMIMGLMVGFIALSVLLPIFQLIHVFRK